MKKNLIIIPILILICFFIFLVDCKSELTDARNTIDSLEKELSKLKMENILKDEKIKDHNILVNNLNILLSTVYYASAKPKEEGREKNFTAFSMFYKNKFYLITAGHCIEYDGIKYTNFKFKSNIREGWVYPELLYYENDYEINKDYAIFYHHSIRSGLIIDEDDKEPKYILGNTRRKINFFKKFETVFEGESGSPILSSGCKLVGIVIKNNNLYTPIDVVTNTIDKLNSKTNNK